MVDDNALLVLRKRYLIKDNKGNPVEIPDEMFHRVAGFIAWAEDSYTWQEGNLAKFTSKHTDWISRGSLFF
jgi:ribonucleoside-diphosphate reductase alpha chain